MTYKDKRLWGIERTSDTPERIVFIYNALVKLNLPENFSIVDIAGGRGVIINGIAGLFPNCKPAIVDIVCYPHDWKKFRKSVKIYIMPLQDFIKLDLSFDVVMMLNSYRNWKKNDKIEERRTARNNFDAWLPTHAKYFITSGADLPYEQGEINGYDYRRMLQLFKLPLAFK